MTSNAIAPGAILVDSVEQLLREIAPKFKWGSAWEDIEKGAVRDMVPNDIGRGLFLGFRRYHFDC